MVDGLSTEQLNELRKYDTPTICNVIELFDVQFATPHLESMGVVTWSRGRYLDHLRPAVARDVDLAGAAPGAVQPLLELLEQS